MVTYSQSLFQFDSVALRERIMIVGLVILLHVAVFASWRMVPDVPVVQVNAMSVSFANVRMEQADVVPQPKPREVEPIPAVVPAVKEVAPPVTPDVSPPSQVLLDAEPDYRADYLNNPRPPYPLVARRMGYHGKVILNVEVLAEGRAGQVLLQQGCGHDILDEAALQTVKSWRFIPARRFGQPVTQWFQIPIRFSLEGNEV